MAHSINGSLEEVYVDYLPENRMSDVWDFPEKLSRYDWLVAVMGKSLGGNPTMIHRVCKKPMQIRHFCGR